MRAVPFVFSINEGTEILIRRWQITSAAKAAIWSRVTAQLKLRPYERSTRAVPFVFSINERKEILIKSSQITSAAEAAIWSRVTAQLKLRPSERSTRAVPFQILDRQALRNSD